MNDPIVNFTITRGGCFIYDIHYTTNNDCLFIIMLLSGMILLFLAYFVYDVIYYKRIPKKEWDKIGDYYDRCSKV